MAYILLFGGNDADLGQADRGPQFWGNALFPPTAQIRGRVGSLVQEIPMTVPSLARIETAALLDLQPFLSTGVASSIRVTAAIEDAQRLRLTINIDQQTMTFSENWGAQQ